MTLKNKIAVVTGSSRGIGRAIAERLAKEGALVVVHYGSNSKAADETVRAIKSESGAAFALPANTNMAETTTGITRKRFTLRLLCLT